jgi:hypothetical protein
MKMRNWRGDFEKRKAAEPERTEKEKRKAKAKEEKCGNFNV